MATAPAELSGYQKGILEIKRRCVAAKIPVEVTQGLFEDTGLEIQLAAGTLPRLVTIVNDADVDAFLSVEFEQIRFVENYNAITNYTNGWIEAAVRPVGPLALVFRSVFGKKVSPGTPAEKLSLEASDTIKLTSPKSGSKLEVSLGVSSEVFSAFTTVVGWSSPSFTLQIVGAEIRKNQEAIALLEKIANSFFFQIDLIHGISLTLEKERKAGRARKASSGTKPQLTFPGNQYDNRAMSLYWYARVSRGMPLLQFLAFYQVVEFYYPMFSEKDAIHRLKTLLKDPRFDLHSDSDLSRVLRTIKPSQRGFGSELQQLTATIRACVDARDLRVFFNEDEDRRSFYETNYKQVTKQQIPLKNTSADLFLETAHRLYEIRCRIVHTKDSAEEVDTEPLLPFSRESEQLHFDIELMDFVAKKVLITASQRLDL